jgi:ketosteroid isomerase-like protein
VHEHRAVAVLADGDLAVINWHFEFTGQDSKRLRFDQLALQTWNGDRIVEERFFYDSASLTMSEEPTTASAV